MQNPDKISAKTLQIILLRRARRYVAAAKDPTTKLSPGLLQKKENELAAARAAWAKRPKEEKRQYQKNSMEVASLLQSINMNENLSSIMSNWKLFKERL